MTRDPYSLRARDLMSKDVVSVTPNDTVHDALQLIVENRVYALPVVDRRDHCIGMLSCSDLIQITHEFDDDLAAAARDEGAATRWLIDKLSHGFGEDAVAQHMTENVASVGAEDTLVDASQVMLRNHVHRLPVVDGSGKLVGILSTMDVMRAFVEAPRKK